jgi:hypothetical protein
MADVQESRSPCWHAHRERNGITLVESEPKTRMSVRTQTARFVSVFSLKNNGERPGLLFNGKKQCPVNTAHKKT